MNGLCIGLLCLAPQTNQILDPRERSVPAEELVMEFYTPKYMDPMELAAIVHGLAGSTFNAVEADSVARHVDSLRAFERSVLIYETQERAQKLFQLMEQLDRVAAQEYEERQAQKRAQKAEEGAAVVSYAYRPKFLSMQDLQKALLHFRNLYPTGIDFVHDTGLLIMTVPAEVRDQVLALLSQIDVAPPQISVTAYLIRGAGMPVRRPAPAELAEGLEQLLGYEFVNIEAQSMLRASADATELSLRLDGEGKVHYELSLRPTAFSAEERSWSLQECRLDRISKQAESEDFPATPIQERVFSTQTVVFADEYTVLGATGSAPELVVLRVRQDVQAH